MSTIAVPLPPSVLTSPPSFAPPDPFQTLESSWLAAFADALRTPEQEHEYQTCLANPAHFIDTHCQVQSDSGIGLVPFRLFDYQTQLLDTFQAHREVIILKARQLGITELVAAYAIWKCLIPYQTVVAISQGEDEAGELVHKARLAWEHLPDYLRPKLKNPRLTTSLIFDNGSRILPKPSTGRSGRGVSAHLLILDEWATQMDAAAVYSAAAPAATSAGNQIIGISTANGAGNFFHQQWQAAQDGHGMHSVFLPWHTRPGRDALWYRDATKTYTPSQCAEAYPSTAEEAFTLSGRPVFDLDALAVIARGIQSPDDTPLGTDTQGRPLGYQRIWQAPLPGRRYVAGADTAEGKVKGDYSSAVILDWEDGTEVAELHGHWEPAVFAHHLASLCATYNNALLGVERNNHGHTVLLALDKLEGYGKHIYHHTEYDAKSKTSVTKPAGWDTTSKSKPIMIDALGVAIKEQRPYRNALFIAEARTYTYKDNGDMAASGSLHDDRVISYSIAEQMRKAPQIKTVLAMGAASGGWGKSR